MNATPAEPLEKPIRERSPLALGLARLIPWVLLLAMLVITFLIWQQQVQVQQAGDQARLDREMERARSGILARMDSYEGMLTGLRGLFSANGETSLERWRLYVETLNIRQRYPAISGVGFIAAVPADMRQLFEETAHLEGQSEYAIIPSGERPFYFPVQYIEPLADNTSQLGYDIATNPVLRAAVERARDTGQAVITAQINQGEQAAGQPRFMMFLPVYGPGAPHADAGERQSALLGWIYAPFRGSELVSGILGSEASMVDLQVFDGLSGAPPDLLYAAVMREPRPPAPTLTTTTTVEIGGQTWTLRLNTLPAFQAADSSQPLFVLLGGVLLSFMLFALMLTLSRTRANALSIADRMTKQLRESEQRFRLITENAADLIAVVDTQGKRLYNSPAYAKTLGYAPEELKGTWAFGQIEPEDRPRVEQAAQQAITSGQGQTLEYRMHCKDGSLLTLESISSPVYNAQGQVDSLVIVARDITARKEAEETQRREQSLRKQNEYLAALHETTLALVSHLDLTELLQIIISHAGELIGTEHGYVYLREPGEDDITMRVGVGAYGGFIGTHARPGVGLAGLVWQTGEPLVVDDYRTWKHRLASSSRDILRAVVGMPLKLGGEVIGVIGLARLEKDRPFTPGEVETLERFARLAAVALENARLYSTIQRELAERKRTETALTEERNLFRMLMDTVPDTIYFKDVDSRFIRVNQAYAQRFGFNNPDQLLLKTDFDVFTMEHARPAFEDEQTIIHTGQPLIDKEEKETLADGRVKWVSTTKLPLRNAQGEIIGTYGISRDITERKRTEETIQSQNAYLTALHDMTLGLVKRLDVKELLQNIVARAGVLLGTGHGYVYLHEPGAGEIEMRVGVGTYANLVGTRVKPGVGLAGTVWQTGEPVVVDDYRTWEHRMSNPGREVLRAVTGVPLISGAEVIGVIGLAYVDDQRKFGPAEMDLLHRFAELAAVALDNARLFEQTQTALEATRRMAEREAKLTAINDRIHATTDVQSILRIAVEELRRTTGRPRAVVRLNSMDGHALDLKSRERDN